MTSHSIEIPDAVLLWEVEYELPETNDPYGVFVVRAVVGAARHVVFERRYDEQPLDGKGPSWSEGIYDADDARRKAAEELAAKLKALLS